MKYLSLLIIIALAKTCGNSKTTPVNMPNDFQIEYSMSGGMVNMNRSIVIKKGKCIDKGREDDGPDYTYEWTMEDTQELQDLYSQLRKLNAFTLAYKNGGEVYDRGGESIRYTINGKDYQVKNNESNFINKSDADAFQKSIDLIVNFSLKFRKPVEPASSTQGSSNNTIDSTSAGEIPDPNTAPPPSLSEEEYVIPGIPAKMPNDFKIKYEMSGGISGSYRTVLLQFGTSNDEGKKSGESKYAKNWMNKDLKEYEQLYADLYKLNAFSFKYTTNGKVADRGGEKVTYTINKKEYIVSDKDNDFIKPSDKNLFKKSIGLILSYSDKHQ